MDNYTDEKTVGFASDIRPLFTDVDVDHMSFMFDLSSYDDVKSNAQDIYDRVTDTNPRTRMPKPPIPPWDKASQDLFKAWMDGGFQP